MITELFLRNRRGVSLTAGERAAFEKSVSEVRAMAPHTALIHPGETASECALILDGFMSRYIDDQKGLRQLVAIHIPGEFIDLHSYVTSELEHGIEALTAATIAVIPHKAIDDLIAAHPGIARKLWFATLIDAALHRNWLFRIGRLDAVGRVAHFISEMNARLELVDLSDGRHFVLGFTQGDLAEACGLTTVHTNRVVRHLREAELCNIRASRVEILDRKGLERRGDFNPYYLYIEEKQDA